MWKVFIFDNVINNKVIYFFLNEFVDFFKFIWIFYGFENTIFFLTFWVESCYRYIWKICNVTFIFQISIFIFSDVKISLKIQNSEKLINLSETKIGRVSWLFIRQFFYYLLIAFRRFYYAK